MSATFADDFETGTLTTNWPTISGNVTVLPEAAYTGNYGCRVSPVTGTPSQVSTTTTKWAQNTYTWALMSSRFRFNILPVSGTADVFTLQDSGRVDNFDFYLNGDLEFDLRGVTAAFHTGVVPVIGHWYELQARVFFGDTTYTAEVMLDGTTYPVLNSPGETSGFVRSFFFGTSSTAKNYQVDVDNIYLYLDTVQPPWRVFSDISVSAGAPCAAWDVSPTSSRWTADSPCAGWNAGSPQT